LILSRIISFPQLFIGPLTPSLETIIQLLYHFGVAKDKTS